MDKMSKWIVKYRNMILAVAIVLLIPSAIGYFNTNINYDLLSYLPSTSESMKTQKILGDDFNLSSVDFLVVNNKTDQEAAKIKEEINKIDGVENVFGEMMYWISLFQNRQFQKAFRICYILVTAQ